MGGRGEEGRGEGDTSIEDRCGECNGDNTTCKLMKGNSIVITEQVSVVTGVRGGMRGREGGREGGPGRGQRTG